MKSPYVICKESRSGVIPPPPCCPRRTGEPVLLQRFIGQDGHRVCQVQTSGILPHGDADAAAAVFFPQPLGQSGGLLAEHQPAVGGKACLGIVSWGFGRGQPHIGLGMQGEKVLDVVIHRQVHHVPVVQSRPAHRLFADVKAQGADEMQPASGGGAGAGDVAAILGNFRFH